MPSKKGRKNSNQGRVYFIGQLAPTLTEMSGGGRQPYIVVRYDRNIKDTGSK